MTTTSKRSRVTRVVAPRIEYSTVFILRRVNPNFYATVRTKDNQPVDKWLLFKDFAAKELA